MKLIITTIMAFLFVSCAEQQANFTVKHVDATEIKSDLFIGLPVVIKINQADSILWISDCSTDFMVSGVHKKTGEVLCQIARKGNGPSEMLPPVQIFFSNTNLRLYDRNKFRLYKTSIDSILTGKRNGLVESISLSNGYSLIHKLTDTTYIGTGLLDKRFAIIDSSGKELYQTGELPMFWQDEKSFSNRVRSMYHQTTRLTNHPSLPLFAACTFDVLTAYSIGANAITEVFQIPLHDYSYSFTDGEFISTSKSPDSITGIRDIACDSENIYVLYDNRRQGDRSNDGCNEIRVYDWNGVLLTKLIANVNLSIITLDIQEKAIYGISYDEKDPAIWKVQL